MLYLVPILLAALFLLVSFLFLVRYAEKKSGKKVVWYFSKGSPRQNRYAVIIITALLISLGIYLWASAKSLQLDKLDHLSASDNNVYIKFDHTLYHLNAEGKLLNSVKLSSLGIEGDLSDMQVLKDGNVLIGDFLSRKIRNCNMETFKCRVVGPVSSKRLRNPFSFFADESRGLLFIIDTSRHQLFVQNLEGNNIQEIADENTLTYPNDVRVNDDGIVQVADTDNHRIIRFKFHDNAVEEVESIYVNKGKLARASHDWPVASIQTTGKDLWILNANSDMKYADLVVYDNSGKPKRRVPLKNQADPFEIAFAGGNILLTDSENSKVYSINPESYSITPFGDIAFKTEVKKFVNKKLFYKNIRWFVLFFFIISVACAFALDMFITFRGDIEKEQDNESRIRFWKTKK